MRTRIAALAGLLLLAAVPALCPRGRRQAGPGRRFQVARRSDRGRQVHLHPRRQGGRGQTSREDAQGPRRRPQGSGRRRFQEADRPLRPHQRGRPPEERGRAAAAHRRRGRLPEPTPAPGQAQGRGQGGGRHLPDQRREHARADLHPLRQRLRLRHRADQGGRCQGPAAGPRQGAAREHHQPDVGGAARGPDPGQVQGRGHQLHRRGGGQGPQEGAPRRDAGPEEFPPCRLR